MSIWSRIKSNRRHKPNRQANKQASNHNKSIESNQTPNPDQWLNEHIQDNISEDLEKNIKIFDNLLGTNDDFDMHRFRVFGQYPAVMYYFSNLIEQSNINIEILRPLMAYPDHFEGKSLKQDDLKNVLRDEVLYHSEGKLESQISNIVDALIRGETVVMVEGLSEVLVVGTRHLDKRSITSPQTEQVIRGPREGFIEMLGTNISLMRYRLQTPNFRVKTTEVGKLTKTKVAVCYIEGIANPSLVDEVHTRLDAIEIDGILDSGYIEQFIEDNHFSPFPQVQNTERPDKSVANLLEGRVVIIVDGSPFGLIVPAVFSQFYQTAEDYAERFVMSSFVRFARLIALVFSLIFPSLYIAIISFNPELIPTEFAVAVAGGRSGVPFPAVLEVMVMETVMEVLREATIRLPQQVGGALSIVGVLVVGQAAVSAGFASPITVVIIALTTIGSFATPAYNAALALRLLRFPLMILAGVFGLYGVMIGLIVIANHMLTLKSFGVPYMSPVVPGNFQGMKDTAIRSPFWWMKKRPAQLHPLNKDRGNTSKNRKDQPKNNTLDPLKAGNQRGNTADGLSQADHSDPSSSDSD